MCNFLFINTAVFMGMTNYRNGPENDHNRPQRSWIRLQRTYCGYISPFLDFLLEALNDWDLQCTR